MKYLSPACESIRIETEPSFTASTQDVSDMKGLTEDNPAPLSQILPVFVKYEKLEPDIQENLKKGDGTFATNYRRKIIDGIDYLFEVVTIKDVQGYYYCYYYQTEANASEVKEFYLHYNVYCFLDVILFQIRHKADDGHYEYELSKEVRKKMPTFCKLLSNAQMSGKNQPFGLPMIIFLDPERKYPLLSGRFEFHEANHKEILVKVHQSFNTIVEQMMDEVFKTRTLKQTIWLAFRKGLQGGFWLRRLPLLP